VWSRRFAVTSIVALALLVVLAFLGFASGFALVEWKAARLGLDALYFTSPDEPFHIRLVSAVVFALPVLVAWIATLIHRVRSGADASTLATVCYLAVPILTLVVIELLVIRSGPLDPGGVAPMVTATSLVPLAWGERLALLIVLALWGVVAIRARRRS
jgi:hypothetical protein